MTVDTIDRSFAHLSTKQLEQFEALDKLYRWWNEKINVISRKDIDNLYCHHIVHSLGIAKIIHFSTGSRILDVGTGGGFPGIPLAILNPYSKFVLVDSIGKKIKVAKSIAEAIGLTNVEAIHCNVIEEKRKFDFVVSRAVMNCSELVKLVQKNICHHQNNTLKNGLICLKGGDLTEELKPFGSKAKVWNLSDYFDDEFFETKKVVHIPL